MSLIQTEKENRKKRKEKSTVNAVSLSMASTIIVGAFSFSSFFFSPNKRLLNVSKVELTHVCQIHSYSKHIQCSNANQSTKQPNMNVNVTFHEWQTHFECLTQIYDYNKHHSHCVLTKFVAKMPLWAHDSIRLMLIAFCYWLQFLFHSCLPKRIWFKSTKQTKKKHLIITKCPSSVAKI